MGDTNEKPCMDGVKMNPPNSVTPCSFSYYGAVQVEIDKNGVALEIQGGWDIQLTWQEWRNLHAITEYYLKEIN